MSKSFKKMMSPGIPAEKIFYIVLSYFIFWYGVSSIVCPILYQAYGYAVSSAFSNSILIILIIWCVFSCKKWFTAQFMWFKKDLKHNITMVLLIYAGFTLAGTLTSNFCMNFAGSMAQNQTTIDLGQKITPIMQTISTVAIAPVSEEIIFRGAIYRSLRNKMSFMKASIISSMFFGIMHVLPSIAVGNYAQLIWLIDYTVSGWFFALAYEKTDSVYSGMFVHAVGNLLTVIV